MTNRWITAAATFGAAAVVFSAAALAQTPSPGVTVTPDVTISPVASASITATLTETSTAIATGTSVVTGTAVATGTTVSGTPVVIPTIAVPTTIYVPGGTGGFAFADPAFKNVWTRTDQPVLSGQVSRTWFWGPGPNTPGLTEQYDQGAGGRRLVQYFDKSRMEINNPAGDRSQPFFVTNGLLTEELISGFIQVGDNNYVQYHPACIPMSGDFGDVLAPTYFAFQGVSNTQAGDHPSTNRIGQNATNTIDRNGVTGTDASKASVPGVNFVYFDPTTKHNIPKVFWDFLNSSGPVVSTTGQIENEQLIQPWNYASGLPISEPYWARAKINGQVKDVMIQAFERRVLTYVPTNQAGFQVEMGNIGQHYFDWRYRNFGYCTSVPVVTPTAPVVAPTGTVTVVSGTPQPTGTAVSGTTTPSAGTTGTPTLFVETATPSVEPGRTETPPGTPIP
jgi:hypothetical protein